MQEEGVVNVAFWEGGVEGGAVVVVEGGVELPAGEEIGVGECPAAD